MSEQFSITILLIFGLFFSGCGTFYKAKGIYNISPEFGAYTNAYKEYKKIYLGTDKINYAIDIEFAHLEYPTVGQCQRYSNILKPRTIIIDYTYWFKSSDDIRLRLIFHELGHCDLNCHHQETEAGIMNEHISSGKLKNTEIENLFMECR